VVLARSFSGRGPPSVSEVFFPSSTFFFPQKPVGTRAFLPWASFSLAARVFTGVFPFLWIAAPPNVEQLDSASSNAFGAVFRGSFYHFFLLSDALFDRRGF